jgi:F420-non-reducing hydrogenase iron-sulfur subunit
MKAAAKPSRGVWKGRNIQTMCTGRLDPAFIIEAYAKCADGVIIVGCSPGDCHYVSGNYKAKRNFMLLKRTLSQLGIEPERLRAEWITRCDATTFLSIIGEFIDAVKRLGPLQRSYESLSKMSELNQSNES